MKKFDLAKQHMEQGMMLLEQYGLTYNNDTVVQAVNYAALLGDMGQAEQGLSALEKCASVVKKYNSDQCLDYAAVQGGHRLSVLNGRTDQAGRTALVLSALSTAASTQRNRNGSQRRKMKSIKPLCKPASILQKPYPRETNK